MLARLRELPFFVLLLVLSGLAMLLPAIYALSLDAFAIARSFFYACILILLISALIGLSLNTYKATSIARNHLLTLVSAYLLLPLVFAVPFHEGHGQTTYFDAWFEMLSDFTTTGSTLYDNPWRVHPSLHLWRAIVGWFGGLFTLVTVLAILAPMNLGGFEVRAALENSNQAQSFVQIVRVAGTSERLTRFTWQIFPVYGALTGALWIGLTATGDSPFVALCHAMSTLSTSGISPIGGVYWAESGFAGEILIFLFMGFAITRWAFAGGNMLQERGRIYQDPEVRMALVLLIVVPAFLYLRHFFSSIEESRIEGIGAGLTSLWGSIFTTMSFLTTTGFESKAFPTVMDWSELSSPGLVLVGLALTGGGIATTAGGVKLLRIYALFRHSERELERLVHPSSVGGSGQEARRIRRQGAQISWVFFMLFALSIIGTMVALSLTGVQFENAMVLAVASLSNTGPLVELAAETPISISGITDGAKFVLAIAMVLGRLEALAIIALFNPDLWRK